MSHPLHSKIAFNPSDRAIEENIQGRIRTPPESRPDNPRSPSEYGIPRHIASRYMQVSIGANLEKR